MQTFDKWESFIEAHIHVRGWETKEQVTAQDPKLCLPLQYHPTPNKSFLHSVPTYNRNPWSHPHSCSLFRESASCRLNGKGFLLWYRLLPHTTYCRYTPKNQKVRLGQWRPKNETAHQTLLGKASTHPYMAVKFRKQQHWEGKPLQVRSLQKGENSLSTFSWSTNSPQPGERLDSIWLFRQTQW